MAQLDAMIRKLEVSLGKKHATCEFDVLRSKFGDAPVQNAEPVKEEAKQEAAP
jgi:aminoacyl tRNA synthase complex-interacting multifunctional protein 1